MERQRAKPHDLYITPDNLTKTFKKIRDSVGLFDSLKALERPSFHEIRSLASRELAKAGYAKSDVQGFLGHGLQKTTEIYLNNPDAITDADYRKTMKGLDLVTLRSGN